MWASRIEHRRGGSGGAAQRRHEAMPEHGEMIAGTGGAQQSYFHGLRGPGRSDKKSLSDRQL
jgi:hypothetical protein